MEVRQVARTRVKPALEVELLQVVPATHATCHLVALHANRKMMPTSCFSPTHISRGEGRGMRHVANEIEKLFLWGAK